MFGFVEKMKREKRVGKKIKKQQQFFADGAFAENIISAKAISRKKIRKKVENKNLSKFMALISELYLW